MQMPQDTAAGLPGCFRWAPGAGAFAGGGRILPDPQGEIGFKAISARPARQALQQLGGVLGSGQGFCVSDTALPEGASAGRGEFLTLTGGSSGQPKLVRRNQRSWIASFEANARLFGFSQGDSVAVFGALSHSLSFYAVLEALHLGMDIHMLADLSPLRQRGGIDRAGVSVLYLTPTQLRLLVTGADVSPMPQVRLILCGGGALDPGTRDLAGHIFPKARLREFYGAAETSFVALSDEETPAGSVGRAYPGVTIELRGGSGKVTEGSGEIWASSPYLFDGYALGVSGGATRDGDFVSVGEIGRIDRDGMLWLEGRKSRVVQIADMTVQPEVVESFLAGIPQVGECAVVPVPDRLRGHRLIAVLAGPEDPALAHALRAACRDRFGPLLTPGVVLFHPAFPRLDSGKADLVALAIWAGQQA